MKSSSVMPELFNEIGEKMNTIKERSEIEEEYKWDLSTIFKSQKEFEAFYQETKKLIEE